MSAVAFYFVTLDQLPKVGYLTRTDVWNIFNFCLLFLSTVENAIVYTMARMEFETNFITKFDQFVGLLYVVLSIAGIIWFFFPVFEYERNQRQRMEQSLKSTILHKMGQEQHYKMLSEKKIN